MLLVLEVLVEDVVFAVFELEVVLVRTVELLDFVSLLAVELLVLTEAFDSVLAGAAFAVLCAVGVAVLVFVLCTEGASFFGAGAGFTFFGVE